MPVGTEWQHANPPQRQYDTLPLGRFQHHEPHEVVHDCEHGQLLVDAIDTFCAKYIHVKCLLEVPQIRLYLPSLAIELCQIFCWILLGIEERGDERDLPRSATVRDDRVPQLSHYKRRRKNGPLLSRYPLRLVLRLVVFNDLIATANPLNPA